MIHYADFRRDMNSLGLFLVLLLGVILIVAALSFFITHTFFGFGLSSNKNTVQMRTQKDESGKIVFVRCPICNTPLAKNENLISKVFRPMDVHDQMMYVLGCPHCYPVPEPGIKRECPVCHKVIPLSGHLTARLFNHTTDGKKHVLVTGCSECCKH